MAISTPEYANLIDELTKRKNQAVQSATAAAQGEAQRRGLVNQGGTSDIEMSLRGARTTPIEQSYQTTIAQTLQNLADQEAGRRYQTSEREATQRYGTGERIGSQDWQSQQARANQAWQTGERVGSQGFQTGERKGTQDWQKAMTEAAQRYGTSERLGTQQYNTAERLGTQQYGTSERLGTQGYNSLEAQKAREAELMAQGFIDPYTKKWVSTGSIGGTNIPASYTDIATGQTITEAQYNALLEAVKAHPEDTRLAYSLRRLTRNEAETIGGTPLYGQAGIQNFSHAQQERMQNALQAFQAGESEKERTFMKSMTAEERAFYEANKPKQAPWYQQVLGSALGTAASGGVGKILGKIF